MKNLLDMSGKRAVVTGARQGLGKVFAEALAGAGAEICLMARNVSALEEAAAEIHQKTHAKCLICPIDVTDEASVEHAAAFVGEQMGGLDNLINNAAVGRGSTPLQDVSPEEWNGAISTNLTGTFLAMKYFGRIMIAQRSGRIINLTSLAMRTVLYGVYTGAYDCSKAGIECLTRCMAAEWAQYNIRINAISPGLFLTDINRQFSKENKGFYDAITEKIPLQRWGDPEEIGALALYLCSDTADYVTGADFHIDGGYALW